MVSHSEGLKGEVPFFTRITRSFNVKVGTGVRQSLKEILIHRRDLK